MPLKFNVGDTVRIEGDNDVWDGTVATIVELTNDSRYPYLIHVSSSDRYGAVGGKFEWNEESLVLFDSERGKLDRAIEAAFPARLDVFYSPTTGCAVVMDFHGVFHRVLSDGTVDRL